MQRSTLRIASLPLSFLIAAAAVGQDETKPSQKPAQKHMVRFSFKQGTARVSVLEMDMTMTMNIGAADMVTKTNTKIWTTTTVKTAKGNTAEMEQKITRVTAVADSLVLKINYDSNDKDSDPGQMEALAELVGETTTMKLTDQGKMSDVKLPDAANEMLAASGVDLHEILKTMVTQLPDRPIAVGETWNVEQEFPIAGFGKADGVMLYKLLAIDKKTITLQQTLVLDISKVQIPGVKEFTMTTKGTSRLDLMTGSPIEMDITSTTKVGGPMKMDIIIRQQIKPAATPKTQTKTKPAKPTTGGKVQPVKTQAAQTGK